MEQATLTRAYGRPNDADTAAALRNGGADLWCVLPGAPMWCRRTSATGRTYGFGLFRVWGGFWGWLSRVGSRVSWRS